MTPYKTSVIAKANFPMKKLYVMSSLLAISIFSHASAFREVSDGDLQPKNAAAINTNFESVKNEFLNTVHRSGTEIIRGAKTFSNATTFSAGATFATAITVQPTSNQVILGVTRTATLNAPTPASSSRVYTFPDMTSDYSVVADTGTQTIAGIKTFSTQLIGKGTITNDSAATGYIGELISSATLRSAPFTLVSDTAKSVAAITLTAGEWDLHGYGGFAPNGSGTGRFYDAAISQTNNTIPSSSTLGVPSSSGEVRTYHDASVTDADAIPSALMATVKLTSTTTFYLVVRTNITAGSINGYGSIWARRPR